MSTTAGADNLRPGHSERVIRVSRHGAWDAVEVGRPSTAGLEFVGCLVKWCVASGAGVDTLFGHVLIVFSSERGFGSLLAQDAKLFFAPAVSGIVRSQRRLSRAGIPLLRTACHSWSDFSTGYDMLLDELDEVKNELKNGMVGIDKLRAVARMKGETDFGGVASRVVGFVKV